MFPSRIVRRQVIIAGVANVRAGQGNWVIKRHFMTLFVFRN
jgi:hypothetical protein